MRNFLATIFRGFGWGLGFSVALLFLMWAYTSFIEQPSQKVEHVWPDDEFSNTERIDSNELQKLSVEINENYMVEGKIIVSGQVINRNDRDIFWLNIKTTVFLDEKVIEVCISEDKPRIKPENEIEFITFCESKWTELKLEDLRIETTIEKANAYKNT